MGCSTLHIKTEIECRVFLFDEEKGIAKLGSYFNLEVRKGEQDLLFVSTKEESLRCPMLYNVKENDCDYRILLEKSQFQKLSQDFLTMMHLAGQGDSGAQCNLGLCYAKGDGVEKDYVEAAKWFCKAAMQGSYLAQYYFGYCFFSGKGVGQDYKKAVEWYTKAAEQRFAEAQFNLGNCYKEGRGVEQDYKKAVEWYTKAAEQGFAEAQYELGFSYYKGQGVEMDYTEAVKWYRKAAEKGNAIAQCNLGKCYEYGNGVEKNNDEAVKWYRKAVEQDNAIGQTYLGQCYEYGNGVEKDYVEAVKWFRIAAEKGNPNGQSCLSRCYFEGLGVLKDFDEAEKWYNKAVKQGYRDVLCEIHSEILKCLKAAKQGNAEAQVCLGNRYYDGRGVEKDFEEAVKWYSKAAEQGNAYANYKLAKCYDFGEGVERNRTEAIKYYHMAAELGNSNAQAMLGYLYKSGLGVEENIIKAIKWYHKAAEQGDSGSQYFLGSCYKKCKNYSDAAKWYRKSAEQGYSGAEEALESMECELFKSMTYIIDKKLVDLQNEGCHLTTRVTKTYSGEKIGLYVNPDWSGLEDDNLFAYTKDGRSFSRNDSLVVWRRFGELQAVVINDSERADFEKGNIIINTDKTPYYLFFDTETTGVPKDYEEPAKNTKNWPRLVQLGWILTNKDGFALNRGNEIVRPEGFDIPTDAAKVHGITTEKALQVGKPLQEVIELFLSDVKKAQCLVGHNISFDQRIVGAELYRLGLPDIVSGMHCICTMQSTVDFCKIDHYWREGYKYPQLQELYGKLFGHKFEDAHDAMADITATMKCFFELKRIGVI